MYITKNRHRVRTLFKRIDEKSIPYIVTLDNMGESIKLEIIYRQGLDDVEAVDDIVNDLFKDEKLGGLRALRQSKND